MSRPLEIIALSGKAGVGKDYLYDHYLRPLGFYNWALANHFKLWLVGRRAWSYEDVFFRKPPECRAAMQAEGTARGREVYGEDVWCETTLAWLRFFNERWGLNRWVITDVRFPNEVEFFQRNGGKVFRIVAPTRAAKSGLSAEARAHISETALDDFTNFDGLIYNDPAYAETLRHQILDLLNETYVSVATAWDEDSPDY